MMCHRIGRPPISTIGFGRYSVSSLSLVPRPPARITTFIRPDTRCEFSFIVENVGIPVGPPLRARGSSRFFDEHGAASDKECEKPRYRSVQDDPGTVGLVGRGGRLEQAEGEIGLDLGELALLHLLRDQFIELGL